LTVISVILLLSTVGCTSEPPDTSAPQRIEIDRTDDWRGALLYIADENGPTEGWGSIRIYDNVSGFVEKTVEQTLAAAPSDMYVTRDESTMYVSSLGNGRIDIFSWDGNNWNRTGKTIEAPSTSLLTMVPGPDGRLYIANGSPGSTRDRLFAFDPTTDELTGAVALSAINEVHGIAWSADGTSAFISGDTDSGPSLIKTAWPSGNLLAAIEIPLANVNQVVASPDNKQLYVMGQGGITVVDTATFKVMGSLNPSTLPGSTYVDSDFSADGRYLFTDASEAGMDSTLYVVDLQSSQLVNTVKHISFKANGIQRVE
jgi:sugar lactone lactonase YvrE